MGAIMKYKMHKAFAMTETTVLQKPEKDLWLVYRTSTEFDSIPPCPEAFLGNLCVNHIDKFAIPFWFVRISSLEQFVTKYGKCVIENAGNFMSI